MWNIWRSPLIVLLSLMITSCVSAKFSQCQNLKTILDEAKFIQVPQTAKDYVRLGQEIQEFNQKLIAIQITDQTLSALHKKLADTYGSMAQLSPQVNQAAIAMDRQIHDQTIQQLQNLSSQEVSLIAEINSYCQSQ